MDEANLDQETAERIEQPVDAEAEHETRLTPAEAVARMRINVPVRGNRKLRTLIERVNDDDHLKGWWHVSNVNAVSRMEINDHSWVHIQIVTNIALKLLRQLTKHGVEPGLVRDFGLEQDDAEVVVVLAALFHCVGMSIHRHGHEDFSLFLAEPKLRQLLDGLYEEPDKTVIVSEALQAIISHRADGEPLTVDAGIVRVADALDMAKGRSRIPFEKGSLSCADVERMAEFLRALGWNEDAESEPAHRLFQGTNGIVVALYAAKNYEPEFGPRGDGFRGFTLGVNLAAQEEVDRVYELLQN